MEGCAKKNSYQFSPNRENRAILKAITGSGSSARLDTVTVLGRLQSGLENRAAGRGDGFRSGGGEQVSKARKRRATRRLPSLVGQDTILSHRKAAGHPAAFHRHGAYPWEVGAPVDSVTVSALAHRSKRNRQVPG